MKIFTKLYFKVMVLCACLVSASILVSCSKQGGAAPIDVEFIVPEEVEINSSATEYSFRVQYNKAPLESDKIVFEDSGKVEHVCDIISVTKKKFSVSLFDGIESGTYSIYLKRDSQSKYMGKMVVTMNYSGDGVKPEAGSTVYGKVLCNGKGVSGVSVSDGVTVVRTDADGVYQLPSQKELGYVFVSVPGGYEPITKGILPKMYYMLAKEAKDAERVDFTLKKVDSQDSYKMLFFGDMHLANRKYANSSSGFYAFINDVKTYTDFSGQGKVYAMTLGDMTWDIYWYGAEGDPYTIDSYVEDINNGLQDTGLMIYHTIGNHDNDMKANKSNLLAKNPYVTKLAPNYYSFNIGKVHYVVLDNFDCKNSAPDARNYSKNFNLEMVSGRPELDWLKKDLSFVDKNTPVIITVHAPVFYPAGGNSFLPSDIFSHYDGFLSAIEGFSNVNVVTGHTHMVFNVAPSDYAENFREHNSGAVCASWWWSGYLTPNVYVSVDGSPGGYAVWDVDGTDIKWRYKATGKPEDYQFRSYDLNNVSVSLSDFTEAVRNNANVKKEINSYISDYPADSKSNEVLINIWNWNSDWTLEVTDENGKTLEYTQGPAYDPLHLKTMSVKRLNRINETASLPQFLAEKKTNHFFRVKADNADVDLTITVTDEFGNVYTEKMQRPKPFDTLTDQEYAKY